MRTKSVLALAILICAGMLAVPEDAQAVPGFARKYNLACSSCHTAMPYLNYTGRRFKEAGYRMPDEDGMIDPDTEPTSKVSNALIFDKPIPISARLFGRPYDKKEGEDSKLDVIHEVELFFAGSFWKSGSYFVEAESEDEEEFSPELLGEFGWHPSTQFNIQGGISSIFHADPYNSLKDGGHRLTVAHKLALDYGEDNEARFRKDAQNVTFYGRQNKFFWLASISGGNENDEGENPKDILARVAVDITPDIMVGAFYFDGEREEIGVDLSRWALDFNLDFDDFHIVGLYGNYEDDYLGGPTEDNDAGYVELFYTMQRDNRPFFVPLVRYDMSQYNDGQDDYNTLTAQISFYLIENARVGIEYHNDLDNLPGEEKLNRITVFADVAF